ncbi:MAG: RNA polymerase sigma factor [Isosphaeraceae bacterium]
MRGESSRDVLRHLRTLYRCGVVGPLGDEQLLDRFLSDRDEAAEEAFAELVQRHGPMVLGVCRRILGDAHEAEDAFQATFLVLARKAGSVLRREKVANWLYGVAVRTAKEARGRASRRRTREERVSTPIHVEPPDEGFPDELRAILDEELARLPARYRAPVVLCELEGLSRPEAARRLDIPEGTLSSRLSRAKAQLRDRLARRGVTVPAVVLSTALIREAQAVSLPISLIEATVQAATHAAAGASATAVLSASVASLSEGVLKAMLFAKFKGVSLGIGAMAAVISGAVVLAQTGPVTKDVKVGDPLQQSFKTKVATPPSEVDRSAALEKKLDRILDALDRLSGPKPPPIELEPPPAARPGPRPTPNPEPRSRRLATRRGAMTRAIPQPEYDEIPPSADARAMQPARSRRIPEPESDEIPPPRPPENEPPRPGPDDRDPFQTDDHQLQVEPAPPPAIAANGAQPNPFEPSPVPASIRPDRMRTVRPNPGSITDRLNALEERMDLFEQVTRQVRAELTELRRQVGGTGIPVPAAPPAPQRR